MSLKKNVLLRESIAQERRRRSSTKEEIDSFSDEISVARERHLLDEINASQERCHQSSHFTVSENEVHEFDCKKNDLIDGGSREPSSAGTFYSRSSLEHNGRGGGRSPGSIVEGEMQSRSIDEGRVLGRSVNEEGFDYVGEATCKGTNRGGGVTGRD